MDIKQIIVEYAPLAANIAMTIVIPFIIKNFSLKRLQKRIDEVNNDKEFGIVNKKYIPIQNICIGVFSGILCYFAGLSDNLLVIILTCLISSLGAGGLYDATQTKK